MDYFNTIGTTEDYSSMGGNLFNMNNLFNAMGSLVILAIIALIAAIIVSIVVWVLYVGRKATNTENFVTKFFRFHSFYVDDILKAIYLFLTIAVAFGFVVSFIGSFMVGIDYFFPTFLSAVVTFIIAEVLLRVSFELLLMFIRLVRDTRDIKDTLGQRPRTAGLPFTPRPRPQNTPVNSAQAVNSTQATAPKAPATRVESATQAPVPPTAHPQPTTSSATWECPQCHRINDHGKFCGSCGTPRPQTDAEE